MIYGKENPINFEDKRKRLHLNSDMVLDVELGYELQKYFEGTGLPEKVSKQESERALKSFTYFLSINFGYYYCEKALRIDQFPLADKVDIYFKPELRLLLVRCKNLEMLKKHGHIGINFNEVQYSAVKSCFLELSKVHKQ